MSASEVFRQTLQSTVLDNSELMRICLNEYAYQSAARQVFDAGLPSAIAARDVFMQAHLNYDDPITAGYVCNALNVLLDDDHAAMFAVHVGAAPHMDAQRRLNAALLADLPEPFSCSMDVGTNEYDALLSWDSSHHRAPNTLHRVFRSLCSVPLEIGRSNPETLYLHALLSGGFARWPYGSEWIYIYGCGLFNRLQQSLGL